MWPFTRPKPEPHRERASLAVIDLTERLEVVERKLRDLETDWNQTYDKFHRLSMRLAKRAKTIEQAEDGSEKTPEDRSGGPNGGTRIQNPLAMQLLSRGRIK